MNDPAVEVTECGYGTDRPIRLEVRNLTLADLDERRREALGRLGLTYGELAVRAATRSLAGDEWAAWEELREIDFLRGGTP